MNKTSKLITLILILSFLFSIPFLLGTNFVVHSPWTKSGTSVYVVRTTDNVDIGGTSPGGKLQITGDTDEIQCVIRANSTQSNSNPLILFEKSDGTDLLHIHSDDTTTTFLGLNAGLNNTAGSGLYNTYLGSLSGVSPTTSDNNTGVGYLALNLGAGGQCTAVGSGALYKGGGGNNEAFGYQALFSLTSGNYNCAFGTAALDAVTGTHQNCAFGHNTLTNATSTQNSAFGAGAGSQITSGNNNVCIGFESGDLTTTGSNNISIGHSTDPPSATTSYHLNIGDTIYGDLSTDKIGIGHNAPTGTLELYDWTDLAAESLNETDFATHANWDVTGDFDDTGGNATYTHNTGSGTLTQTSANMAVAGVANRWYIFTYNISGSSGDAAANITTSFASSTTALTISDGNQITYFKSASSPGNFVISGTSTSGGFTLDDVSLKQMLGGDLICNGIITGGGSTGVKIGANGNVGIGTESPIDITHIEVADPVVYIQDTESNAASAAAWLKAGESDAGGDTQVMYRFGFNASNFDFGYTNDDNQGSGSYTNFFRLDGSNGIANINTIRDLSGGNLVLQDDSGNVGIGNTSPNATLDVTGAINSRWYHWIDEFDYEAVGVQFESGLTADGWVTAGTNYAAANVTFIQISSGGVQAITAGADDDSVTFTYINNIKINKTPILQARFKILDISNACIYVGLVEGSFADKAAIDDDVILVGFDSDNGHGKGADHLILVTNDDGAGAIYDDTNIVISANTFYIIRIDTSDTEQPRVWIDQTEVPAANISGTIQDNIWVSQYMMVQSLSGAADTFTGDFIEVWQQR